MAKVVEWFRGKKSYFIAAGLGLVVALQTAGLIDNSMAEVAYGLLGAGGLATVAAKINRAANGG